MTDFPERPKDEYESLYLEDTDKQLPEKINPNTRYAYFKTIARGGKAIIQSCKDLHLSRIVCYKTLKPEFADNEIEQQRFLREARVSALLQHPGTIPTYELGRDTKGRYYFTMKLVHGYTLREILNYRERYDLEQLIDVIVQVANALEYAHSHRVIHRDIKPENILVGPYGEVLLMDWGLAKVWRKDGSSEEVSEQPKTISRKKVSSMSDLEDLQGTLSYMSPEQLNRDPEIDYRTDIYSLGVVLYEILAGELPFIGEMVNEVKQLILQEEPVKPSRKTSAYVPKLLESIAMQCIKKDPKARLQQMSEFTRLLKEDWSPMKS